MERERSLRALPDDELLRGLFDLLRQSRHVESELVAHIGEVDARRLYTREACSSMFAYCTERLHLSEAEAYLRITAARASRAYPVLLAMLADGRLHLTGIGKLAPHLTPENADALLGRAAHKPKRQIEELVAEIAPRPDVPDAFRRLSGPRRPAAPALARDARGEAVLPRLSDQGRVAVGTTKPFAAPGPDGVPSAESGSRDEATPGRELRPDGVAHIGALDRPIVEALAPGRYKVQFTASARLHDKLRRLQALSLPQVPDGDLATLIEEAITEKLERLEARRFARTKAPRKQLRETETNPTARRVRSAVRRAVHERDGGQCRYADERGRRCSERSGLEYHHRYPFGRGGDHSPPNVSLLCRAHNAFLAEHDYGRAVIPRRRGSG